jgi:hypothetical protein
MDDVKQSPLDGYKTLIWTTLALGGTFVFVMKGLLTADDWWKALAAIGTPISVREFADKFRR